MASRVNLTIKFFLRKLEPLLLGIINGFNYLFFILLFTIENFVFVQEFSKVKSGEITLDIFIFYYIMAMVATGQSALIVFFISSPFREWVKKDWKKKNQKVKQILNKILNHVLPPSV